MPDGALPVLDVRDLKTVFKTRTGEVHAVNSVSFDLRPGELLGVVGESGSGKSVTMMSLIGLLPSPPAEVRAGQVLFDGRDLLLVDADELRAIRGARVGFIFQDPMTSLNPVFTVGFQLMEPLRTHMGMKKKQAAKRAAELLELVGIPDAAGRLDDFPHQFSGGMRQRVMIAMALACDPEVLIADEPTTALDVTIQAQILDLMKTLQQRIGMSVLLITHDLGIVAQTTRRVVVMYAGRVVEEAPTRELFKSPLHPYTRGLLNSLPGRYEDMKGKRFLPSIPGMVPNLIDLPRGCPFRDRCEKAFEPCGEMPPPTRWVAETMHAVSCWLYDEWKVKDVRKTA